MEKRIRLKISYDGTAYHGWQIQDGMVTVEGVLAEAIGEAVGKPVEVIGASRTDAGVHALGNIAFPDPRKVTGPAFHLGKYARTGGTQTQRAFQRKLSTVFPVFLINNAFHNS